MLLKPKSAGEQTEESVSGGAVVEGESCTPALRRRTHTATCYLDVEVVVQQQVFGLQVSVNNAAAVTEMHRGHDLLEFLPGVLLGHAAVRHQVVCERKTQRTKTCQLGPKIAL